MGTKKPSILKSPSVSKTPKLASEPTSQKNQYISWQLHLIDSGFKWGIGCIKKRIKLDKFDDIPDSFTNISELFCDSLIENTGKEHNSFEHFIDKLKFESEERISVQQLQYILKLINENIFWTEIYPKLQHFENKTWNEIERETYGSKNKTKHHSIKISNIIPEAQKRLRELRLDDLEELFSLRLDGKTRIWGVRKFHFLQILWFDFEHEICPVKN